MFIARYTSLGALQRSAMFGHVAPREREILGVLSGYRYIPPTEQRPPLTTDY